MTSSTIAMFIVVGNFGLWPLLDELPNIDPNVNDVQKYVDCVK